MLNFASPRASLTVGEGISSTLTSRIPPFISPVQSHHPVLKLKWLAVYSVTDSQTLNINPSACPQPQSQGLGNMSLLFQANHSFSFKVHPPSSPQDLARSTLLSLASVFRQFFSPGSFLLLSEQKGGKETFIFAFALFFYLPLFPSLSVGSWALQKQEPRWSLGCKMSFKEQYQWKQNRAEAGEKPSFGPQCFLR